MSIRTKRNSRRFIAAAAAVAVAASTFIATSSPLSAAPVVTENTRIAGADRYATANGVAIAKVGIARNANRVVLVSGENFPDGLAAASLAGALGAPMLLTQAASLPTSVLAALTTITSLATGTKSVVIVGGTSAVSADVQTQLTASGYTVTRISGADRYATANAVAAATRTNNTGTAIGTFGANNLRTAFLASGTNFPDALAASAQAYKGKHPIFLTNGTTLTDETKAAMIAAGVQQVLILGGTSAVSAEVATAVAGVTGVIASSRIEGATRYDTATALATALGAADAAFKNKAFLVSGTDFPDALVAAQLAGGATGGGAIIPVTSPLPAAITTWVTANQSTLANIQAIGGTTAVSAEIVTAVKTGATTAPLSATITALDGATTATIVFSGAVSLGTAQATTNYTLQASNLTPKTISLATLSALTNTVTLDVAQLAPGDILRVVPNKILSNTVPGLFVAETSVTVTANTTVPVATILAYSGATESAAGTLLKKVWVSFDAAVFNFDCSSLLRIQTGVFGATPQAAFDTAVNVGAINRVFTCQVKANLANTATGDTVSLLAGAVSTSATTPLGNVATSTTAVADTTAPSITSATFTQSGTAATATPAKLVVGGDVTISAKAGTTVGGKAGNSVQVFSAVNEALHASPTCVYTSATNTVTISASATSSALAVANACNVNATFNALFTAAATTAGGMTGYATPVQAPMAGGFDLLIVTLTFSEAINPATFNGTQVTFGGGLATAGGFVTPSGSHLQPLLASRAVIAASTAGTVIAGLSTISLANTVQDRNGNAAATTAVVMTATPAS